MTAISYGAEAAHGERSLPKYVYWITGLTIIYLLFELGFNARLLDVTGGLATRDEIDEIEKIGRLISGIALTLVVWGQFVMPRAHKNGWPRGRLLRVAALWAAICIGFMFWAQKAIIDHIVDGSDGVARRIAVQLRLVSTAAVDGAVIIDGIDLSGERLRNPEGKSFIALLPFMAFSTDELEHKADGVMRQVVRHRIERAVGTPEQFFNDAYRTSVKSIRDSYNSYAEGSNSYARAIEDSPRQQELAWSDYVRELQSRHNRPPSRIPSSHWGRVRDNLLGKGINVPRGWNPADRATFNEAVDAKVRRDALAEFEVRIREKVGASVPPELSWPEFQQHRAIQAKWRESLGAKPGVKLAHDLSPEAVRAQIYEPMVSERVDAEMGRLAAKPTAFADGGEHEQFGREAMQALVVPPIALAFSLIGALTHIVKSMNYTLRLRLPASRKQTAAITALVGALAISAYFDTNEVTQSRVFGYFEQQTTAQFGSVAAMATRWVIQSQPWFYPVNEGIRTTVLLGASFGYHPERPREASAAEREALK